MIFLSIFKIEFGFTYRVTLPKEKDRFEGCCIEYANGEIKEGNADSAYLKIISRGGLTNLIYQPEPHANTH